ncbi:MAG TPA: NADH-quinone oxidoreductase subunit A [Longimicrobiales bacterium]|nr:NADH-quinone oxidoreductase subunit A [Longimicrobiales bacterium]
MLESYVPILILLAVSLANAVGIVILSHLVSPFRPTSAKSDPYESGMTPLGDTRERFSVKFYMVAILFIVFDLETIFLVSWGVVMRALGWEGFIAAMIFIVVLTVGMIYEWKKGALEWE